MEAALVLVTAVLIVVYFARQQRRKRQSISKHSEYEGPLSNTVPQHQQRFQSQISLLEFPDRADAIVWHVNAINKSLSVGDLALANLSYAKLIESIRQQNVNDSGKHEALLTAVRAEYEQFRQVYNMDYPAQFLPKTKHRPENLCNVTSKGIGQNKTEITVDINAEALLARVMQRSGKTEQREKSIEDICGFHGSKQYSPNKEYCVVFCDGYESGSKWKSGEMALLRDKILLYRKKLKRPHDCRVSNVGIVICCDWLASEALTGRFIMLAPSGEEIFVKKTSANLGTCAISEDSGFALFETHISETGDSDKIFLISVEERKVIQRIERPCSFNSAFFDTENRLIRLKNHKGFVFEMDFEGTQTNTAEYEAQILAKGSVYDRLCLYEDQPEEKKFGDAEYLALLAKAFTDSDASYAFGNDKLHRMVGEYHEANGDVDQAIENWEKAIQLNSKVGVKRKLDALKKKAGLSGGIQNDERNVAT